MLWRTALVFAVLKNRFGVPFLALKERTASETHRFIRFQKNKKNTRTKQQVLWNESPKKNSTRGSSRKRFLGFFCVSEEEEHQNEAAGFPLAAANNTSLEEPQKKNPSYSPQEWFFLFRQKQTLTASETQCVSEPLFSLKKKTELFQEEQEPSIQEMVLVFLFQEFKEKKTMVLFLKPQSGSWGSSRSEKESGSEHQNGRPQEEEPQELLNKDLFH